MNFFQRGVLHAFNVFYPCKVYCKQNVPEGGAVFICNHVSGLDGGFVADVYSKDIYFLAKKELFKNKFFGKIIKTFGLIPIDRENTDLKSMLNAIRVVKEGHKLVIFPEGTRNKADNGELQEIKGGAALFAVKAKKPLVPLYIYKKPKIFRKTRIIVGKPFEFTEYYGKKLTSEDFEAMDLIIAEKLIEQKNILTEKVKNKEKC